MDALFSDYEDLRKSGLFDPEHYLASYPDVAERNVDPLVHYLEEGAAEGRDPNPNFDAAFYLEQCRQKGEQPQNPLLHYIRIGQARGFETRRRTGERSPAAQPEPNPAQDAVKAPILVAIESLGAVGAADGKSRFSVGGWALATAVIEEISVSIDGELAGTAIYGLARPDVARLYPDRPAAAHSGFMLAFDLPAFTSGAIEPLLTVRTVEGEVGNRPLRVEIPPQQVDIEIVDPLYETGGEPSRAPMELYIDDAAVDQHGILRVTGWVVCIVQIEAVEGFIDGAPVGAAEFGRARTDVEKLHPDYPNARFPGFALVTDVGHYGAGGKTLTMRATARDGIIRETTTQIEIRERLLAPEPTQDARFYYHADEITLTTRGRLVLRGWVVCPAAADSVVVLFDGEEIGQAELGLERPDVRNLFPAVPHARRPGFAFDGPIGKPASGEHIVTLRVIRRDGEVDAAAISVIASEEKEIPAAMAAGDADRKLQVDRPYLIDGVAAAPIRGNLEIGGWALARAGVSTIEIGLDGKAIGVADYGLRRLDIRAAFPGWENSLSSGYTALLPHRVLPTGSHTISVTLRDLAGAATSAEFVIEVEELSEAPGPWSLRRKMPQAEINLDRRIIQHSGRAPVFVVVLPLGAGPADIAQAAATIASLRAQAYENWRLLIVTQKAAGAALLRDGLLAGYPELAARADIVHDLTPRALAGLVSGTGTPADHIFFTVVTPGDDLGCDALLEMAMAAATYPDADFLYSDERCRNPASGEVAAFFKPQWSPDLLLSTNYVGRLWCARADLLRAATASGGSLLADGEYDLVLCLTENAKAIRHVPVVLCERAAAPDDDPALSKRALERMLKRRGLAGDVRAGAVPGVHRVRRDLVTPGLVSIVIPTCAAEGMIEQCISTLREVTAYRDFEIVCVENIPSKDRKWRTWLRRNADRVVSAKGPFNWAHFNNLAVAETRGEYLLFLNDDIEITDPEWLTGLLEHAQRPEIGVVGPRLLYPDGRVQHAGMFLAALGQARHAFRYATEDNPGYFGLALTQRNVIAVTGACLMTRRETFEALDGFDESQSIVNNDLDYCLRVWRGGLLNIYTPHVSLVHHEAVSRSALADEYDEAIFDGKWRELFVAGDPYFSPHLSKAHDDYTVDFEPTRLLATGRPILRREDIRKILVVKLDHIGDCVIAFPAVRRLKQHFPAARISVLTSNASRPVWALEQSVDETIAFDFFHARSGLGELDRSADDWEELRGRLAPQGFDLAIDLRKHLETRQALQYSGARYLAGFDYRNQFPWLDIALEWEGDQIYTRKRQHNGDDLVNLVDAVAAAGDDDRLAIRARLPVTPAILAIERNLAKSGPLVCVHPTVGNDARQWPGEYFAAVIDRLVAEDGARILIIGGPGDDEVAAAIIERVRHPQAVTSLVGKLPLGDLPALLTRVSLFVGNNSGPKHIAAGLGVPTVGIHSGTEDVLEWGPVGPSAIAVAREVVCAPCYLAKADDCRRGLACLRQLEPARVYEACKRLLLLAEAAQPELSSDDDRSRGLATAQKPARAAGRRRAAPRSGAVTGAT